MSNFAIDKALQNIKSKYKSITVPFFFNKEKREYMCRVKINMSDRETEPVYQIYFFDITEENKKINEGFIFARGFEDLRKKVYEFYNKLK